MKRFRRCRLPVAGSQQRPATTHGPLATGHRHLIIAMLFLFTAVAANAGDHYLANLKLTDQNGRRVDLYNDLIHGRTVIINSFFASCTGSCPVMGRTFLHLQNRLGDRVGKDVFLVSITVDPETDTPPRLKEYAQRMGARQGWYFLTGTRAEVDAALRKIGQYAEAREMHKNIIIAGNDRTGLWKKAMGVAKADEVYEVVASVVEDRGAAPPAGGQ